jgi:hypothetical protein
VSQAAKRKSQPTAVTSKGKPAQRSIRAEKAHQLAVAIEGHMSNMGFSERDKNERVSRFAERVDRAISRRAKS